MILSHHHFTIDIKKIYINLLVLLYDFICSFIKYHVCSLIARLVQVRVGHVYREANQYTNFLAKRDGSMMENFPVFNFYPSADMFILIDSYRHVANTLTSVGNL